MRSLEFMGALMAGAVLLGTPCLAGKIAGGPGPGQPVNSAATPAAASLVYTLVSSQVVAGGDGTQVVSPGYTNVGGVRTLNCPGPGTCRISSELFVEMYQGSVANNFLSAALLIDGTQATVPVIAPFVGQIPSDGSAVAGTIFASRAQLAPGSHTLQMQVYTTQGATLAYFNGEFHLYGVAKQ